MPPPTILDPRFGSDRGLYTTTDAQYALPYVHAERMYIHHVKHTVWQSIQSTRVLSYVYLRTFRRKGKRAPQSAAYMKMQTRLAMVECIEF